MNKDVFSGSRLVWITFFFSIVLSFLVYLIHGITEESIRLNIRITARISFLLFSLAFIASSLQEISKSNFSRFLMKNRRSIGLSFGASHIVHLINILILLFAIHNGNIDGLGGFKKLLPAILVYVYIFIMMLTSNNFSMKLMGSKVWTGIHRVGMYAIASALGLGFYKVIEKNPILYLSLLTILIAEVALRLYAYARSHILKNR